jgi:hypothetical protein
VFLGAELSLADRAKSAEDLSHSKINDQNLYFHFYLPSFSQIILSSRRKLRMLSLNPSRILKAQRSVVLGWKALSSVASQYDVVIVGGGPGL